MKLLVLLFLVALVAAAPPREYDSSGAQILRYQNDNTGSGSYRYSFEQSDGTKQEQQGDLQNEGREDEHIVVKGSFTWIAPNGVRYTITYTADQNGYQPEIEEGPGSGLSLDAYNSLLGG